ncbi:RidA family protein [Candidatus Uabimicrobium sp. HlEnr_7]|uniref:RidA family protein n=1 Tax=Candidatus Uabimicrobium helgolandensis TaxID=3095367 RepID=UPI003557B703
MKKVLLIAIIFTVCTVFITVTSHQDIYGEDNSVDAEKNLKSLGITLQPPRPFKANFVRSVRTGNLIFLSGHISIDEQGKLIMGKVGKDLDVDQGKEAARRCAIGLLASLKGAVGDLNNVQRIVKVTGMVNASEDFTGHSTVINGCSDLLVEIFGKENGKHARAAVGMSSLPLGVAVEIEMIVEVK